MVKALLLLLTLSVPCVADTFIPDFASNPDVTSQGYLIAQGSVFGIISTIGKSMFDSTGDYGRSIDWLPCVALSAGQLLIHSVYFSEGGKNQGLVLQEQGWETVGTLMPLVVF